MRKTILFLVAFALLIISCKKETTTPLPIASFTVNKTNATTADTIITTNTSTDANVYSWDFGDGYSTIEKNPIHVYATGGTYVITLKVTGTGGSDVITKSIVIINSKTTYRVKNSCSFTLYGVSSFYWDGSKIYDFLNHGDLTAGLISSAIVETERTEIKIGLKFSDTGSAHVVAKSYILEKGKLNILEVKNTTLVIKK